MFPRTKAALLPLWAIVGLHLVLVPVQAQPQTAAPSGPAASSPRQDPADPKARVPSALYASPLRTYQAFSEPQVGSWSETNELVRQRGGWRAYAREAREPDATRPSAPSASQPLPAAKPAASGHAGHEMK